MDALLDLTKDIRHFLWVRKKHLLARLVIATVLLEVLVVFAQGSFAASFVYIIF